MKKTILMFAMCFGMIWMSAPVFALSLADEQGSIQIEAVHNFGNDTTGGTIHGVTNADFVAKDFNAARGEADGSVVLKGTAIEGEHIATSSAIGVVDTSSFANGALFSKVGESGSVIQGNWATLDKGENFAMAGNQTKADFIGNRSGRYSIIADGSALVFGKSVVSLDDTGSRREASAITIGGALATLHMQGGDPSASGFGRSTIGLTIMAGRTAAALTANSIANFTAQGPNLAGGFLKTSSNGSITLLPNGVKATASSTAGSKAFGK